MDEIIFDRAKELFGEQRFEEILGELWLQREALATRARGRQGLDTILREWEDRFRRDVEEGRHCVQKNKRRRDVRFSELGDGDPDDGEAPEDLLAGRIRRKF